MAEQVDPNIPSGLSKLLSQGNMSLASGQTEQAVMLYCKAYAWDPCVTQTHLNTLSQQSFQAFISVLEDYCLWGFDTGRRCPIYDTNLTLEQLCDWLTKSNMKPDSLVAWATKVNIQMQRKKFVDVIDSCSYVLRFVSSKETSFLITRASAHLNLRHTHDAVLDYITAIETNYRVTSEYIQERPSKNVSEVIEVFYEFIDKLKQETSDKPRDVDTNLRLVKCYEFIMMLQPDDVTSCLECADILTQLYKHKDAVVFLSEAMEAAQLKDTDMLCLALQRAEIYLAIGEDELALSDYLVASRINQECTQSALQLLPVQTQSKIIEQANRFADNVLAQCRSQSKSCNSCFINTQINNDQLSRAYDCYCLVFLTDSTNVDVLLNSAECLFLQRKEPEALEVYSKAVTMEPKSPRTYCARASCFVSLGDLGSALRDYNYAVSIKPGDPRALCGKICALVLVGQLEQSVTALINAVNKNGLQVVDYIKELHFEQKEAFCMRLTMFLKNSLKSASAGDQEEALCLVGQVLTRIFSNDLDSHLVYAEVLLLFSKVDESQSILVRFVNNNPSSYQAAVCLALLKLRMGKLTIAIKELCTILLTIGEGKLSEVFKEVEPKVRRLVAREVYLQGIRKNVTPSEKVTYFTLAIIANPTEAWMCYFNRGKQHFASGKLDLALKDFSSALNINPKHVPSYLMRSLVLIRQLQWKESMNNLLAAFHIDSKVLVRIILQLPEQTRKTLLGVLLNCVQNCFSLFNSSGVKSELILPLSLLLVQSDSSVPMYHSTLADAYFVFGNYQEAVKQLEIIELLSPSVDTFVIGQLGLAHVKLSNFSAAVNSFVRMSELDRSGLEYLLETLNIDQRQTLAQQAVNQGDDLLICSNYAAALAFLNLAVVTTKGQRSDVLRKRCECLNGLQSYSCALDDVTSLISLGNALIFDYCTRATLRLKLGEFAGACADAMKALDMDEKIAINTFKRNPDVDPASLFVKVAIGHCNNRRGRQALQICTYGLKFDPGHEELRNIKDKLESGASRSCVVQ